MAKEIKYNVFDVTEAIGKGNNAVGVILGSGRFVAMRRNQAEDEESGT